MRRVDPFLTLGCLLLAGVLMWSAAPFAVGAIAPVPSDARIELDVPVATSVTPGWRMGDAAVRLPNLSIPGQAHDQASDGWQMSTNWANGYEVRIRATTDPAMRGRNAVDNDGARDNFKDFSTAAGCPCPWTSAGVDKGIFGYSVSVDSSSGSPVLDADKWGTNRARRWRGFSQGSYRAYSTPGGPGRYEMTIHLRSMIPEGAFQSEGSYRASIVVSAHPLL